MTPTEFVAGLADIMDVERTEIATVDRTLAKHGMRQLARGRYRPDVTLREGVQIVCAWAAAHNLTDAAAEVERLKRFHANTIPPDEYELVKAKYKSFTIDLGDKDNQLYGREFLWVVSWVAQQLGTKKFPAKDIWVSIEKAGSPQIIYRAGLTSERLSFMELGKLGQNSEAPQSNVKTITEFRGSVLKWIFDVTEGG